MVKIILASKSKVRKKILDSNNIENVVKPSSVDEDSVKLSLLKANSSPEIPTCSNGRAEDNWRPLIGIAELADGIWPERARKAFSKFNSESEGGDEETMRVQVLRDIQTIFDQTEEKGMWSESLIEKLIEMEDQPWSEYKGGCKPISPHSLGRLLKPFGIGSVQIWESGSNRRGYRRDQFEDAFTRFL